jgi:cell division protein FtsB
VKRPLRWGLRWLSRVVVIAIVGAFVTVTGLQYARIIEKNAAMAAQLATAQSDVAALRAKSVDQNREIRRLSDPAGAITRRSSTSKNMTTDAKVVFSNPPDRVATPFICLSTLHGYAPCRRM